MIPWRKLRRTSSYEPNADCVILLRLVRDGVKWRTISWDSANWIGEDGLPEGAAASAAGELARYSIVSRAGSLVSEVARSAIQSLKR